MKSPVGILVSVVLLAAAVATMVWYVHRAIVRRAANAAFAAHIDEYLNEYSSDYLKKKAEIDPSASPALHSRMVVVNRETRQLDPAFFDVPDDLRASGPESAGILVVTSYEENKVGRYGTIPYISGIAYDCVARYDFIDLVQHKFTGRIQFANSPPRSVTASTFDHHAPHPTDLFLFTLAELHRRKD